MAVVGILCEYDPLHRGHVRQFDAIRGRFGADTPIVCLMSGSFVQRGRPAVFAPEVRAAAAVDCGASLVLEMPVHCVLRSAEGYAAAAADIFSRLGAVDTMCFGAEHADEELLQKTARILDSEAYEAELKRQLSLRISYPAARQRALRQLGLDDTLLREPNDILAVEYCRALQNTDISPFVIERRGGYHDTLCDPENPSATAVRALLPDGAWRDLVPEAAAGHYENAQLFRLQSGERAMLARLRAMSEEDWSRVPFGSEGLYHRVYRAVQTEASLQSVAEAAKSKRYVRSRLDRMLLCAYLGIDPELSEAPAAALRILGFDERGRSLLRSLHGQSRLPLLHPGEPIADARFAELERRCNGLSTLFSTENGGMYAAFAKKSKIYSKK